MIKSWENLQHLLECTSTEDLRTAVDTRIEQLGFDNWIYADDAPNSRRHGRLVAYPDNWIEHYRRQGYIDIDPVVSHCRQHLTPCLWASNPAARRAGYLTGYFSEAVDFGLHAGIGLPAHGPDHSGRLTVATADASSAGAHLGQIGELQLLASSVHEVVRRLGGRESRERVHLTSREIECLRCAADGKTSWEIGQQLGISERTAIFHLNNSARKLGVMGRRQAIARAMSLELITL
ncbi:MAG TPA: LuxR family transcriptional regulator [Dokdonella sp.]|uniref:LuxR family transcriptional regulator n=1 Tax=Dokdonella sp. TaxID=2291710 RepID=UPI002D7FD9CB|nr:LuxR family transcriptional regulator [Dokdonella sp.]HET9032911.1 LuxR family transcriptional regulator [Dokdonella sp.]